MILPAPHLRSLADRTRLIVDGEPFLVLGAETHNSTASSPTHLRAAFEKFVRHNCNTALVPISWELVEPREGEFDFASVDWTLDLAREHGLRLIPLWFGTWKNGQSTYAPDWVKTNGERFPRAHTAPGVACRTLSAWGEETLAADARAFGKLMAHVRERDAERTIIMVQVENEPGLLGAPRDVSPVAERAFERGVPGELGTEGSWGEVYGDAADESFMAWGTARFIGHVAAAGRAEYDLPMFANAWLDQPEQRPGEWPSGGPTAKMHGIWSVAAPAIDFLAPDIYDANFTERVGEFAALPENPVFVPETGVLHAMGDVGLVGHVLAARATWIFAAHNAIGFSPFGLDSGEDVPLLADAYAVLASAAPRLLEEQGTENLRAIFQTDQIHEWVDFGPWRLRFDYDARNAETAPGYGFVLRLAEDEFLLAGGHWMVFPETTDGAGQADFLWVEEGEFVEGEWRAARRLNGDDIWASGHRVPAGISLRRVRLYRY